MFHTFIFLLQNILLLFIEHALLPFYFYFSFLTCLLLCVESSASCFTPLSYSCYFLRFFFAFTHKLFLLFLLLVLVSSFSQRGSLPI
jgi:hypothetical protein